MLEGFLFFHLKLFFFSIQREAEMLTRWESPTNEGELTCLIFDVSYFVHGESVCWLVIFSSSVQGEVEKGGEIK